MEWNHSNELLRTKTSKVINKLQGSQKCSNSLQVKDIRMWWCLARESFPFIHSFIRPANRVDTISPKIISSLNLVKDKPYFITQSALDKWKY